jgi:hypothetical protein
MNGHVQQSSDARKGAVRLSAIQEALALECLAPPKDDFEVETGFASDLLSEVLARAPQRCVLVTTQTNMNLVAVASCADIAGVIIASGYRPGIEVLVRAREEGVGVYATPFETFDVVCGLSRLGLRGRQMFGLSQG